MGIRIGVVAEVSVAARGAVAAVLAFALTACFASGRGTVESTNGQTTTSGTQASASADSAGPPEPPPAPAAASAPPEPTPVARPELPRGGRKLFPTYELVGFCGTPGAGPALGRLEGNLSAKATVIEGYAGKYAVKRKTLPVFELIAVVVQGWPGPDGKYRRRVDDAVVEDYLKAARASKALLLLNIQPGQSDFVTEVQHFEKYLHEPDVGIALDPEWAMKTGQKPGKVFGQTTGETINEVAAYMSSIVQQGDLPEKALVFHEVHPGVVKGETVVKPFDGVAVIKSVDGLGPKHAKIKTYDYLMGLMTPGVHPGFKLFFDEDRLNGGVLMTPSEVLGLAPPPEYVMYE